MRLEVVLLCLSVVAGCKRDADVEAVPGPKAVKCAAVQVAAVKDWIEIRGTVAPLPNRDAQVTPQVSGRILRIDVREGDTVAAGQIVARIDDAPLVDAAQQADAALARARAEHDNARTTLVRVERVYRDGIAARQEVDDSAAKAASAKAAEAEAQAAARVAHRQIDRATVRSPLKGVVLKVLRNPGELVDGTPATAVAEVADTSQLELVADVPAQDLVRLRQGAPATVTFAAIPNRSFTATVSRVGPSVDRATGVGTVRVAIEHSEHSDSGQPPVGMFGIARVEVGEPRQAIVVPEAAIRNVAGNEGEVVVCGTDHVAHVRRVVRQAVRHGLVEVGGGLRPGEHVAVKPVLGLSEGDALEVAP